MKKSGMTRDFTEHLNPVFIETGSYVGWGIEAALAAGFKKIISIEVNNYFYQICKEKFKYYKNVNLYFGDSILALPEILEDVNERCTFWLDAHYMSDPHTAGGIIPVPLMVELKIIKRHPIKTHTILIDDIRLLRNHEAEWKDLPYGVSDVEAFIYSINPDYKITYAFGEVEDDILIAQI